MVRAKQTDFLNEGCGVGVEPKVLTYPRNFVAGGAARICAFIRASVDVTTICVYLYGCRESLCCWMIGAEDVGRSFGSSEKPVTTHQGGMCAAILFQRLVAMPSCSQSE